MKKTGAPSSASGNPKYVGSGCYLQSDGERKAASASKPPDNTGKQYFKWDMSSTTVLLKECLDKEVWNIKYGNTERTWMDICVILRTFPGKESLFAKLTWRSCEKEYARNVKLYLADKMAVPFQSGTDKEHAEWEDVMEEIVQFIQDKEVLIQEDKPEYADIQTAKEVEKDMKAVGEFLRDEELLKFTQKKISSAKRSKNAPKTPNKKSTSPLAKEGSDSSDEVQELTPTDRLANALALKVESDLAKAKPTVVETCPTISKLHISEFPNNRAMLTAAGILHDPDVEAYLDTLAQYGFETPLLFLGLKEKLDFMTTTMKFKPGHAFRLIAFLEKFQMD